MNKKELGSLITCENLFVCLIGTANGENDYESEVGDFDPIKHHNSYCPWVNGNVAAAGCYSDTASSSSTPVALCGWQLTLDALDALQSLGHVPNQTMQSESAASLCKVTLILLLFFFLLSLMCASFIEWCSMISTLFTMVVQ